MEHILHVVSNISCVIFHLSQTSVVSFMSHASLTISGRHFKRNLIVLFVEFKDANQTAVNIEMRHSNNERYIQIHNA